MQQRPSNALIVQRLHMFYADPTEACSPLLNSHLVENEVVLIERG